MNIQKIIISGVLTLISFSALAGGGTVGSDTLRASKIKDIDCRQGDNYWGSNKGVNFDIMTMTVQQYKDNGKTKVGSIQPFECNIEGNVVVCQSEKFHLVIDNIRQTHRQTDDGAFSSLLGSMVGVRPAYANVTRGTLTVQGLLFDRAQDVVCSL